MSGSLLCRDFVEIVTKNPSCPLEKGATTLMKNVDPLQRQKRKKKTSRREREGGGKKGENKIKLESVEERRARFKREASTLAEDHGEEKLEEAAANDQQKENTVSAVQGTVDLHTDTNVQSSEEISNKELYSIIRQLKSALEEERAEARDREARLIKKINELDSEVRSLSEKVHQFGAAEEDRAEKLTRRVNDVKACVKSTYQNTYTHTRIGTHSGSTDRASISASRRSTTPPYPASVEAQAPEMERPAPSSRDRNLGQEFETTHVQHQLGQACPNVERRRQQEPQWDAPDDDEALWTLVSEKKPTEKKAVLYLGKLKPGVKESEIIDYVNRRSEKLGALPSTIHNCKIFEKEVEEGEIIEFCGARLTIDKRSSKLLCHRKFWLGPSYARPWNFPDPSEAANSKNGKPK